MTKEANSVAINSFNANHQDYDTFRPDFSPTLVDPFLVELGLAKLDKTDNNYIYDTDKIILEVAAGTGKFTKNLINSGWGDATDKNNLIIVEPSKGMLQSLQANFPTINPKNIFNASSYEIPLKDNSVDSVIIAQGFHWFSDAASLKELSRVLKPNGSLGLIWNGDYPSIAQDVPVAKSEFINGGSAYFGEVILQSHASSTKDILQQFFAKQPWSNLVCEYIYTFDKDVPQYRKGDWRDVLISKDNTFFELPSKELFLLYDILIGKDRVYKYFETRSYITKLDEAKRKEIEANIDKIIEENVTSKSYDKSGQLIKPMITHALALRVKK